MISNQFKCIFIHIPKCAGTSVESALGHFQFYGGRDRQDHRTYRQIQKGVKFSEILKRKSNIIQFFEIAFKKNFKQVRNPLNNIFLDRKELQKYFKFSIVRPPWERLLSWYINVKRDHVHRRKYLNNQDHSFGNFLRQNIGKGPLRSQLDWLEDYDGKIKLDRIVMFDEIGEKVPEILHSIGCKTTFPHELKSDKTMKSETFYNPELFELVCHFYSDEIKFFNFDQKIQL